MKDGALEGNKREELWLLCVDRIFHEGRNLYMEKESIQSRARMRSAMVGLTIKWNTFYSITHKSQSK